MGVIKDKKIMSEITEISIKFVVFGETIIYVYAHV